MRKIVAVMLMLFMCFAEAGLCEPTDALYEVRRYIDLDFLLETVKSVAVNRIYYDAEGGELFSVYAFAEKNEEGALRIVTEDSEGNVEILSEGLSYGFDAWTREIYALVFLADEYQADIEDIKANFFSDVFLNEKLFSDETADGERVMITKSALYAGEEGACQMKVYTFEAESMRLLSICDYSEEADGERCLTSCAWVTIGSDYDESEAFECVRNPEITREIEVIFLNGEAEETACAFYVPMDLEARLVYPQDCILYEDRALTRMFTEIERNEYGLYPEKVTLYLSKL